MKVIYTEDAHIEVQEWDEFTVARLQRDLYDPSAWHYEISTLDGFDVISAFDTCEGNLIRVVTPRLSAVLTDTQYEIVGVLVEAEHECQTEMMENGDVETDHDYLADLVAIQNV